MLRRWARLGRLRLMLGQLLLAGCEGSAASTAVLLQSPLQQQARQPVSLPHSLMQESCNINHTDETFTPKTQLEQRCWVSATLDREQAGRWQQSQVMVSEQTACKHGDQRCIWSTCQCWFLRQALPNSLDASSPHRSCVVQQHSQQKPGNSPGGCWV